MRARLDVVVASVQIDAEDSHRIVQRCPLSGGALLVICPSLRQVLALADVTSWEIGPGDRLELQDIRLHPYLYLCTTKNGDRS